MKVLRYPSYQTLSRAVADKIAEAIRQKPAATVCIASGHTPVGVFKCLLDDIHAGLDISAVTFVSLDEWLGVDANDPGSCISMLRRDFFDHLSLRKDQLVAFDPAGNPDLQCNRMNQWIKEREGLDVMLVGVGLNGHIGMNEPGTSFETYAHISQLAEETITTGQKYFQKPTQLSKGITLGLKHFSESRLPIVMANGKKKASIVEKIIASPATEQIPATIVHQIPQALIMVDTLAD